MTESAYKGIDAAIAIYQYLTVIVIANTIDAAANAHMKVSPNTACGQLGDAPLACTLGDKDGTSLGTAFRYR